MAEMIVLQPGTLVSIQATKSNPTQQSMAPLDISQITFSRQKNEPTERRVGFLVHCIVTLARTRLFLPLPLSIASERQTDKLVSMAIACNAILRTGLICARIILGLQAFLTQHEVA